MMLAEAVVLDAEAGIVVGAPAADRLWIRGGGPSRYRWPWGKVNGGPPPRIVTEEEAVYEVWGIGPDCTRTFQIHPPEILTDSETRWLKKAHVPIYTLKDERKTNPRSVVYPYARVEALVGRGPITCSFDHMLALAIAEGFTDIGLSGIDLQIGTPRERLMEHVGVAYWIGLAVGRGISVRNMGMVLHFPYTYGKDYQKERTFGQRMGFWAALGMLNFQFDDGQAKTAPEGWKFGLHPKKVHVSV